MATVLIQAALAVLVCVVIFKKTYDNAWSNLPSPGLPLPYSSHYPVNPVGCLQIVLTEGTFVYQGWCKRNACDQRGHYFS